MILYFFKKHAHFLNNMKIVEFFSIIWGKLSELEPEPEFSTSWSRTKMDRLRNTSQNRTKIDRLRSIDLYLSASNPYSPQFHDKLT
jgi:hypothetical protein